jgi:hydrogenase-4 component B
LFGLALVALVALAGVWIARRTRAATHDVGTWDCGYTVPSARMQYTSSSFAQLIVGLLGWALRPRIHEPRIDGPFPSRAKFHSEVPDTVLDRGVIPTFRFLARISERVRPLQRGSIHLYLLYIVGTLIVLLVWS